MITRIALVLGLLLASGCALFAPSKADLMAYCVKDPDVKKRAEQVGMTAEQLCEKLLSDEPTPAAMAGDAGKCDGGCPAPR